MYVCYLCVCVRVCVRVCVCVCICIFKCICICNIHIYIYISIYIYIYAGICYHSLATEDSSPSNAALEVKEATLAVDKTAGLPKGPALS